MDFTIRQATVADAEAFVPLLASLGYPNQSSSLRSRIATIVQNPDAELLVAVKKESDQVVGLVSLHFIPQLGIEGEVARIGFFVVGEEFQRSGIGRLLETHAESLCIDRGCNRMVLHMLSVL
jgi:GNAT superfamily N-acetyltransferase